MRTFFLTRQFREKVLLAAFVVIGAAIWATSVVERGGVAWREYRQTSDQLSEQQQWLDSSAEIQAAAAEAVADLDSSRTYNGVRLSAEINAIANSTGVGDHAISDSPRTELTPQFSMHTLQLRLNRVEWGQLERFYDELAKRAPYINIEQFSISADRDGRQLNAAIRVSSVEIAK